MISSPPLASPATPVRALALALVVSSLGLGLVGCRDGRRGQPQDPLGLQAAGAERFAGQTLRVSTFPGYLVPDVTRAFAEHTGARLLVETHASNEELVQRIEAGAPFDVIFPSGYAVERLLLRDRLRPMDRGRVPNLIQVPERFRNPPADPSLRHCVPYTWSVTGLGLLSNRALPGRDPDSLSALFPAGPRSGEPARAREPQPPPMLLLDDMRATLGVALRSLGLSASTRDPQDLQRARDLVLRQAPRIAGFTLDVGPALLRHQVALSLGWSGDVLSASLRDDRIRFIVPREGVLLFIDYACVPRSSGRPELAFAFLNHLLDPQVAAQVANVELYVSPNLGNQRLLRPEARWLVGTLDSLLGTGRFEVPRDVGPAQRYYQEAWDAIKAAAPASPPPAPPATQKR